MSRRRAALLQAGESFADQQRLGVDDVEKLARDRSPARRAEVARKFGNQFDELATCGASDVAKGVLLLLVKDLAREVRQALAEAVATSEQLPAQVASRLARDDIEIARPILENSPVLSDSELIEIVRTNAVQYALAVAGRERLSEALCDALVGTGHEPVVVRVVENQGAQLSKRTLERVLDEFGESRDVTDRLVRRPELPYELVDRLVGVIGNRLAWDLVRTRRMSRDEAERLVQSIRERVSIGAVAHEHGQRGLEQHLRARFAAGELGPDELLAYLRDGNIAGLETALAVMADLPPRRVRRLLYSADRRQLAAVCIRAQLPTPHYVALRMALELAESCVEQNRERVYDSQAVAFLQQQYERLRQDPATVSQLVGDG